MSSASDGSSAQSGSSGSGSDPSSNSNSDASAKVRGWLGGVSGKTRQNLAAYLGQASSAVSNAVGSAASNVGTSFAKACENLAGTDGAVQITNADGSKTNIVAADLSTQAKKCVTFENPGKAPVTYRVERDAGMPGTENTFNMSQSEPESVVRPDSTSSGLNGILPKRPEKPSWYKPPSDISTLPSAPERDPATWDSVSYGTNERYKGGELGTARDHEELERWMVPIATAANSNDQAPTSQSLMNAARRVGSMSATCDPERMADLLIAKQGIVGSGVNLTDPEIRKRFWNDLVSNFSKEIKTPSAMPTSGDGRAMKEAALTPVINGTHYRVDEATYEGRRCNIQALATEFMLLSGSSWVDNKAYSSDTAFKAAVWATDESNFNTGKSDTQVTDEAISKLTSGDTDWNTHTVDLSIVGEEADTQGTEARLGSLGPSFDGYTTPYDKVTAENTATNAGGTGPGTGSDPGSSTGSGASRLRSIANKLAPSALKAFRNIAPLKSSTGG